MMVTDAANDCNRHKQQQPPENCEEGEELGSYHLMSDLAPTFMRLPIPDHIFCADHLISKTIIKTRLVLLAEKTGYFYDALLTATFP